MQARIGSVANNDYKHMDPLISAIKFKKICFSQEVKKQKPVDKQLIARLATRISKIEDSLDNKKTGSTQHKKERSNGTVSC